MNGQPAGKKLWPDLRERIGKESRFLLHPARTLESYQRAYLRPDLLAGLTVAVVLLPQAIAYAMLAGGLVNHACRILGITFE